MARKYIGKLFSGGVIILCVILLFTPETHSQGFIATKKKVQISGSVGLSGVTMQGLPNAPITDENGVYTVEVDYGFSSTVTPVKPGYTFEPNQKVYQAVKTNLTNENYEAKLLTYTISGSAGLPGVTMKGLPDDPITDQAGRYLATVQYGFSGMVQPEKEGYRFEPSTNIYDQITADKRNENYTPHELKFVISGSVGAEGVTMKGLPGDPRSDVDGVYRVEVPYGWDGKVEPNKPGHEFTPAYMEYTDVMEVKTNQTYQARVFTFQIAGSANMAGVVMRGLPGDPITDTNGYYTATVEYGWHGTVTPERAGYDFEPPSRTYPKATADYESQDYNPSIIRLTISGSAGTGGVKMLGLPGDVVSDSTGRFRVTVDFGWAGTITPEKEGYTFDPSNIIFSTVDADQLNQNFKAQRLTYTISGNVSLASVVLEGLPVRTVSGPDGSYSATVDYKWTGSVTPKKSGYTFSPAQRKYTEVLSSQQAQDYSAQIVQHTISGRIITELGPVADAFILADNNGGDATTDADGNYELSVDHGWQGKIIPQKDGHEFTPSSRTFQPVTQDVPNQGFAGKVKMMTITDSIIFGGEPIQGVTITAKPGDTTAVTDTKGKYTIRVPYAWTGELFPQKEGFEFDPPSIAYTNVTENIDNTVSQGGRIVVPPVGTTAQPPTGVSPGAPTPGAPAPETKPPESEAALTERERLEQRLAELQGQIDSLLGRGPTEPNQLTVIQPDTRVTRPPLDVPTVPPVAIGPAVNGVFVGDLIDVLTKISEQTGVGIYIDATVKPTPVSARIAGAPLEQALDSLLDGTGYSSRQIADAYLVYRGITDTYLGEQLRDSLQMIASSAGMPIIPDENVTGEVYAELDDVPLETALEMVLAGTPYVYRQYPNYYLVASGDLEGSVFHRVSETQTVRLNYISADQAVALLSPAFSKYVKAENATDPNVFGTLLGGGGSTPSAGGGHLVTVTATPELAARIVEDLKRLDTRPRHVLLDARIVAMERGDLLNLGVEWGFPTMAAGFFTDSFTAGDRADDLISTSFPYGIQVGFSFDRTFTNALLAALNLLQENNQADIISSPQVLGQDGKRSRIRVVQEERYVLTGPVSQGFFYTQSEFETIESGTILTITPRIGDNNDITLEMAVEVSDSIPSARGTGLPVVTRRMAENVVTVENGGTAALAGLTENRSKVKESRVPGFSNLPVIGGLFRNTEDDKSTREIAVFVTAHLVPETSQTAAYRRGPETVPPAMDLTDEEYQLRLREALSRQ